MVLVRYAHFFIEMNGNYCYFDEISVAHFLFSKKYELSWYLECVTFSTQEGHSAGTFSTAVKVSPRLTQHPGENDIAEL